MIICTHSTMTYVWVLTLMSLHLDSLDLENEGNAKYIRNFLLRGVLRLPQIVVVRRRWLGPTMCLSGDDCSSRSLLSTGTCSACFVTRFLFSLYSSQAHLGYPYMKVTTTCKANAFCKCRWGSQTGWSGYCGGSRSLTGASVRNPSASDSCNLAN